MRIAIDIRHLTDPHPAGVGGYTMNLLHALFCLGERDEFILFATGTKKSLRRLPEFDYPNVRVVTRSIPNKFLNLMTLLTKRPFLENLIPSPRPGIWLFPNLNFISTRLPYAIMAHDLSYKIFPEFFTWKSRLWHRAVRPNRSFDRARAILSPSTSTKRDVMAMYAESDEKVHVTPLATAKVVVYRETSDAPKGARKYILSLATLEPRKNQLSIIEAYEAYRDQSHDEIDLVIAGGRGWKSKPIVRAAKQSKYAKEIHLIGYIDEKQKTDLYRQAQVFLFPSFYEGFGLPILEAMNAGCPVIASHTSSLPELIGDAGILIDPNNVNDLTTAIKLIISSDRLRTDLVKRGLKRSKDFSWEETAKKTLQILKNL